MSKVVHLTFTGNDHQVASSATGECLTIQSPSSSSSIIFHIKDNVEFMRITSEGQVYVRGELVETNRDVYDGLVGWLNGVGMLPRT